MEWKSGVSRWKLLYMEWISNKVILHGTQNEIQCPVMVTQMIKNLSAIQETQVPSLGQEVPLKKETATYPSILPWRIPRTEEPSGLQLERGGRRVGHD